MTIVYYSRTGSAEHYAYQLSSMLRFPSISFTEAMDELLLFHEGNVPFEVMAEI